MAKMSDEQFEALCKMIDARVLALTVATEHPDQVVRRLELEEKVEETTEWARYLFVGFK